MRLWVVRGLMVCAVIALVGCVNNIYSMLYKPMDVPRSVLAQVSGEPKIIQASADPHRDILNLFQDGYAPVGYSGFTYVQQTPDYAIAQAKRVGASVVLMWSKNHPWDAPGEPAPGIYNLTRYDQTAIFLAPLKRIGIGTFTRDVGGVNYGVLVEAVRKESPAAVNDIRPGDILLKVNGQAVHDTKAFNAVMPGSYNRPIEIVLNRGGQQITKSATIPFAW